MIDPSLIPGSDVEKFLEGIHFMSTPAGDIVPMPRNGSPSLHLMAGRKYRFVFATHEAVPSDNLTAPASDV